MTGKRKNRKSTEADNSQLAGLTVSDLRQIYASDAECTTRRTSSRTGWTCLECGEVNKNSASKCADCGTRHYSE